MNNSDMYYKAGLDYLTGLSNRWGLHDYYSSLGLGKIIHAMYIDVDNFKRVNDVYGHSMGDELLVAISNLITTYTEGFAARIGGDEYVVLLDGECSRKHVTRIAEELLKNMQNMDFRKDVLSLISLSIGIVFGQKTDMPLDDILYKCDAAMYKAKNDGKNRFAFFQALDESIRLKKSIETEMEEALRTKQFVVYFQPKINMVSSELYGAEALCRWVHPEDGLRSPALFIPIFEKNGFISKLDFYIYEETCKLKAGWKGTPLEHLPISVNLSRLHLYDKMLPFELADIADEYGIPYGELEIEITESVFIKDTEELVKMVAALKKQGFMVSIDDFGAGFSALNLLKDLPVDTIKLDKEFLQGSADDARGKKVLKNIISLCKDLKLEVVVEGIETKPQIDFVTSCGCRIAQGFFYAKPLPLHEFEVFATEYAKNKLESYIFRFNGSLRSEDGSLEGEYNGMELLFEKGITPDSRSLYLPGGEAEENVVILPNHAIVNDSYTIAMWIKPRELHSWGAALYVKFETGFAAMVPLAWEGVSDFRIRDSRNINGWYDVSGCPAREGVWCHFTVSYNAKTETAISFINGEVVGVMENVPVNRYVNRIMLGGDIFQPSFSGNICEVVIFNEAKDYQTVKEFFTSYVERPGFSHA